MRDFSVIKQRILQYLECKGVSKYECYQKTGIANGVFSQKSGISEDNLLSFLSYYSDISTDWLLTGRGEMLRGADGETSQSQTEPTIIYKSDPLKDEIIALQRDKIKLLEDKLYLMEDKLRPLGQDADFVPRRDIVIGESDTSFLPDKAGTLKRPTHSKEH